MPALEENQGILQKKWTEYKFCQVNIQRYVK